jgi:hypothetical protein
MNRNNINLNSPYESSQEILDGYSFDTILLEIDCNLPVINPETVKAQFEFELQKRLRSAREVFAANLDNIVNHAIKERNK